MGGRKKIKPFHSDDQKQSCGNQIEPSRNDRKTPQCCPLGVSLGHAGVTSVSEIRAEERVSRLREWGLIAHTALEGMHRHTHTRMVGNVKPSTCGGGGPGLYLTSVSPVARQR